MQDLLISILSGKYFSLSNYQKKHRRLRQSPSEILLFKKTNSITFIFFIALLAIPPSLTNAHASIADLLKPDIQALTNNLQSATSTADFNKQQTLTVIDTSMDDWNTIKSSVLNGEVLLLNKGDDSLAKIISKLKKMGKIDLLNIFSHGGKGSLYVQSRIIDSQALKRDTQQWISIAKYLSNDADIRLYACDVAAGATGREFVKSLADLTGADVAASINTTGNDHYNADWRLEFSTGHINSDVTLNQDTLNTFKGVLAWSGTIDFSEIQSTGGYDAGPDINAAVYTDAAQDYTLVADGLLDSTYHGGALTFGNDVIYTNPDQPINGIQESQLSLYFLGNTTFDATSIFITNSSGTVQTFSITSDQGDTTTTTSLLPLASQTVSLDGFSGITTLYIKNNAGGMMGSISIDNFTVANVTDNTAPTLGGTFTTAGEVSDDSTISPFSGVTVSDLELDNVSVTITYNSDNGTLSGPGLSGVAGSYTVKSDPTDKTTQNLQSIVFTPTINQVAAGTTVSTVFTLIPDDGTDSGTANSTTVITTTSVNDSPVISSNDGKENVDVNLNENVSTVTTVAANDADPDSILTYSISGGVDSSLFTIDSGSGLLSFTSPPNFELPTDSDANNTYEIQVSATDNGPGNLLDSQTINVKVKNINENPVITSNGGDIAAAISVLEGQTTVTTVIAVDEDTGDKLEYFITGGVDQDAFHMDKGKGLLTFKNEPDYEAPVDSDANNSYEVQVSAVDDGSGNLADIQDISVLVGNINEAPTITSNGGAESATISLDENSTSVTTITSSDPDNTDTLTYSISGGVDASLFSIGSASGFLTFNNAPNFEIPTDSNSDNNYEVQITVTDDGSGALSDALYITVAVNDTNDAPIITSKGGGDNISIEVPENQTSVTTITATDDDLGDNLQFSISGGFDKEKFVIESSTGALTFITAPDFENSTDKGGNNVYDVQVTVTDDGSNKLSDVQNIAVSITNVNEPPIITSDRGDSSISISTDENTTAVTTVTVTDPDIGDSHTFSISGGTDAASFSIDDTSGALSFKLAPNFESPTDSNGDNNYNVQVTVTDDGTDNLTDSQDISVTINNINDAPIISSNGGGDSASVVTIEGQISVTTVTASDEDGDTLSYAITGGVDQGQFTIDSESGALSFITPANFESPTDSDANNVYELQVTVTDSGSIVLSDIQNINVAINNGDDSPVITSDGGGDSASVNVSENTTAVTTVVGTDPDTGDTLSYSISGGADADKFTISTSNGVLAFIEAPNFESPIDSGVNNIYDIQVTVTDSSSLIDIQNIAVTVVDANEAPTISGAPTTVPSTFSAFSFIPTASDPDANTTLVYSINTIPSWATFNTDTGVLSGTPGPEDAGVATNNIIITVSDGSLSASLSPFSLTVNQGNTPPTISGTPATRIGDMQTYEFIPVSNDVDGDTLTFSITNQPTWAAFDTTNGRLSGMPGNGSVGTTKGIVIGVSDGLHTAVSLPAFDLTVFPDLDGDGIADADDTDIDGDGMDNAFETANGLDPRDPTDAEGDLDNDGLTNLEEFLNGSNPTLDDNPPLVTAPADITVNATGLFTPVDIGLATATDYLDGELNVTSDARSHYKPGKHSITWSAKDATGNVASATQIIHVIPLVEFGRNQISAEGSNVSVKIILNGTAAAYPVTIPYTVSGTASTDGSDHNLSDGEVVIAEANTEGNLSFNLVDDGLGEGMETVIVTMGTPDNAVPGLNTTHIIEIHEGNVAPTLSVFAKQSGQLKRIVSQTDGDVVVSANVQDPNPSDTHSFDWSQSDNSLVDTDTSDNTFTFDPSALLPGLYTIRLIVNDGSASASIGFDLSVVSELPALSDQDTDNDGMNDVSEGVNDNDGDGIPDYLDAITASNALQQKQAIADKFIMEADAGLLITLGSTSLLAGNGQALVSQKEIEDLNNGTTPDEQYTFIGGLFDFNIEKLPVTGQSARIVVPQLSAIPNNAVYQKQTTTGWENFIENDKNHIASAPGSEGYCPPPGDKKYTAGLTNGHWCVQLTIEDGGPNDMDGERNRQIKDPGGVAQRASIPAEMQPVSLSISGSSLSYWLLLGFFATWLLYSGKNKRLLLALFTLPFLSNQANANSLTPDYFGVSYFNVQGTERDKDFEEDLNSLGLNATIEQSDTTRNGWSPYVGYNIREYTSLEIAYIDLGSVTTKISGTTSDVTEYIDRAVNARPATAEGFNLNLVFKKHVNVRFTLLAKVGALFWNAEYELSSGTTKRTFDDDGTSTNLGLATEWLVKPRLPIRFGWNRYTFSDTHVDAWELGTGYWF